MKKNGCPRWVALYAPCAHGQASCPVWGIGEIERARVRCSQGWERRGDRRREWLSEKLDGKLGTRRMRRGGGARDGEEMEGMAALRSSGGGGGARAVAVAWGRRRPRRYQ